MMIPAVIIIARFHFATWLMERLSSIGPTSSGTNSASPYIETNPPKGIALIENLVSPFFLLKESSLGPKPIAYSKQYTLNIFAVIK